MRVKIKNLIILAVLFLLFVSCNSSSNLKDELPLWGSYSTINSIFSEDDFIARIGYGDTTESATVNADVELASFFNTNIQSKIEASEYYISKDGNSENSKQLLKSIQITSDADLFGLQHTDSYYNKQEGLFYRCSYINKNEAWKILEYKLESLEIEITSLFRKYKDENDLMKQIMIGEKINSYAVDFYKLHFFSTIINPIKAGRFSYIDTIIQTVKSECYVNKRNTKINVSISGDSTNRIKTKIENLLSINGFTISDSNEFYKCEILADIRGQEYGKVFIIYPQLSIIIKNNEGLGISSFARQLEKVSSYTQETTERIALNKIENELESCFIKECFSYEYN